MLGDVPKYPDISVRLSLFLSTSTVTSAIKAAANFHLADFIVPSNV
jgi:hypothetical protein